MAFNRSKIQLTASPSSTEAKFLATVHAAKIVKYLWSILFKLGYPRLGPIMFSFSRLPDGISRFHVPPLPCLSLDGSLQRSLDTSGFLKMFFPFLDALLLLIASLCSQWGSVSVHISSLLLCYRLLRTVYCISSCLLRYRLTPQSRYTAWLRRYGTSYRIYRYMCPT